MSMSSIQNPGSILGVNYEQLYISYDESIVEVKVKCFERVPASEVLSKLTDGMRYRNFEVFSMSKLPPCPRIPNLGQRKESIHSFELNELTTGAWNSALKVDEARRQLKDKMAQFILWK